VNVYKLLPVSQKKKSNKSEKTKAICLELVIARESVSDHCQGAGA
jgi:hypothetical protein